MLSDWNLEGSAFVFGSTEHFEQVNKEGGDFNMRCLMRLRPNDELFCAVCADPRRRK